MVHRETSQRAAVKRQDTGRHQDVKQRYGTRQRKIPTLILAAAALGLVLIIGSVVWVVNRATGVETNDTAEGSAEQSSEITEVEEPKEDPLPEAVTAWQNVVENWAQSISGNKSVIIYDLDRDELVASYNTKEEYIMESLYKLFVVYEGYRRIESGEWDPEMIVNSAGQSLITCLDRAIRDSDSACAEPIWALIGHDEMDRIAHEEWGISEETHIATILSNVEDILKIMQRFYVHPDFSDAEMVARMWDSFLNQPPSAGLCDGPCDWRRGLPSGFSDKVEVYNKVGWRWGDGTWATFHDVAIIHFKDSDRWFIVVVMTNRVSHLAIRDLAAQLEASMY